MTRFQPPVSDQPEAGCLFGDSRLLSVGSRRRIAVQIDRRPAGCRGRRRGVRRLPCAARDVRPAESGPAWFHPAIRAGPCGRRPTRGRLDRRTRRPAGWRPAQTSERSGARSERGLAARSRALRSVEAARPRDRARRSVVRRELDAHSRAARVANGSRAAGPPGLPTGAGHHPRLRARRRVQALHSTVRTLRRRTARLPGHGVTPAPDAPGRLLACPAAGSCDALVGPIRVERRRRAAAVCVLRGVSAPRVVHAQARRRSLPRGAHRRLARVRLASHHAGSGAANGFGGLVDGRVRHQRDLRRLCGGTAGGAQASGRHVDGPAPHPRADCGGGCRCGCRERRSSSAIGAILEQIFLRHARSR